MPDRVFTGDTLLIRGTGRTDFQNGDPRAQYESLFGRLLKLPDETLVYPAHDYKGDTVSTIGEERAFNPRLQVTSIDDYVTLMNNLNLPNPKMMDVAVPANMRIGLAQEDRRRSRLGADARRRPRPCWASRTLRSIDLREDHGAEARRRHPRLGACALSRCAGKPAGRRAVAAARALFGQAPRVLLRLRRALRHGGAGGPSSGARRLPAISMAACRPGETVEGPLREVAVSGNAQPIVIDFHCPSRAAINSARF